MQIASQEEFSYTMAVRGLLDGGSVMVRRMRAVAVASEMGGHHYRAPIPSPEVADLHMRARWNTRDVNWQAISEAVEESVRSSQAQDMHLRLRIRRLNSVLISATAMHVGKSKPGKKTKPRTTPPLRDAIKLRNNLRRTVQSNQEDYLAAYG